MPIKCNDCIDEVKEIKKSKISKKPKNSREPLKSRQVKECDNTLNEQFEIFRYAMPSPAKESPFYSLNPVLDMPTAEDNDTSSSGLVINAMESGMEMPTVDSDLKGYKTNDKPLVSSSRNNILENNDLIVDLNDINIDYNFSKLSANLIFRLINGYNDLNYLTTLRSELVNIFKMECKEISLSHNVDNVFFGIRVYPQFSEDFIYNAIHDPYQVDGANMVYSIEFDSRLWDSVVSLSPEEFVPLVIYSIYYSTRKYTLRKIINQIISYQMINGVKVDVRGSGRYELISYAISDAMMKHGSPFNKNNGTNVIMNPLIKSLKMSGDMEYALKKLSSNLDYFKQDSDNRFIVLNWALRVLDDYEHLRLHANHQIKKCIDLTGSLLERRMLTRIVNSIENSDGVVHEAYKEDNKDQSDYPSYNLHDAKDDIIDIKNELNHVDNTNTLIELSARVIKTIDIIQTILINPYLESNYIREWENLLLEYMAIKDSIIESKDYLDHFGGEASFIYLNASMED